jgi:hypothetical protein
MMVFAAGGWFQLNAKLAYGQARNLPFSAGNDSLIWLGGTDWVVYEGTNGQGRLEITDLSRGSSTTVRDHLLNIPAIEYDASTGIAIIGWDATADVLHYQPATHELVPIATVPAEARFKLVAPELAGGDQAVVVRSARSTIDWVADVRKLDKARHSEPLRGPIAAIDVAGRVYFWKSEEDARLRVLDRLGGERALELTERGEIVPDRRGERFAKLSPHTVAVYRVDGTRLWVQPFEQPQQALWLADGMLAVVTETGIARLDPASGKQAAARCGWNFGFSSSPHRMVLPAEPMCARAPR